MANPFAQLSEDNHDQIRKYLRFFRQKREGFLRALTREFDDVKADRLHDENFSREEVEEFTDFLASSIRGQLGADLSSIINMGALSVSQLLESAQEKGLELVLETAAVENQALLEAVEKMSLDALPKNAKRSLALTSLKDEAKAMREEMDVLEENNRRLQMDLAEAKRRIQQQQADAAAAAASSPTAAGKTGGYSRAEGKGTSDGWTSSGGGGGGGGSSDRVRELEEALREAREENDKRVSETSQFMSMKKLMQTQAANIRDLRRRLQRYEPDEVKDDEEEKER